MGHGPPNAKNLLVGGYELVELQAGVRVNRQMTDLVLAHIDVDALVVGKAASRVDHGDHLVSVNLEGILLLLLHQLLIAGA